MATQAQIKAAAEAQAELDEINRKAGYLGAQIMADSRYRDTFKKKDGSVYTLSELDSVTLTSDASAYTQSSLILTFARKDLKDIMAEAAKKGTRLFVNDAPANESDPLIGVSKLADLERVKVGPDPAYVAKLERIIKEGTPVNEPGPVKAAQTITQPVIAKADETQRALPITPAVQSTVTDAPRTDVTLDDKRAPITQPTQRIPAFRTTQDIRTVSVKPVDQKNAAAQPFTMGKITPQTTVLDLIVNGIHTAKEGEAAGLRAAASDRLAEDLKKSKPELAADPKALEAAVNKDLPNSIRSLILELSKDKNIQKKIADGFLDGMRRESPGAEKSQFYQNLKTLASNEKTFPQFLNTNMLDGITKNFEAQARAENGGMVPKTVMEAVASGIMRTRPEIKQYNDAVGQGINDFVRNPEISKQRILHSASTQRQIREGVDKYRREHPFLSFFVSKEYMLKEGQARALKKIEESGAKDKNYSHEIQQGFVDEFNKRTGKELRGEQLANAQAFGRYLSHLPYSKFIQEDISPRRMSSIILGIEHAGDRPSHHLIPPMLISKTNGMRVNVAAAEQTRTEPPKHTGARYIAPAPASAT